MTEQIKLSIKIDNKNPIELNQLTLSLNALASQYDSFLKKSSEFDYKRHERKLYISKLEMGCIYAEFVPAIIPLISDMNSILAFGKYLRDVFEYMTGIKKDLSYKLTKTDCNDLSQLVEQTATDHGSNMNITINGDNNILLPVISLDSIKSNALQNALRKYSDQDSDIRSSYKKELMYWANANFTKNKAFDKVVIEKIDSKPRKVVFDNESDKIIATSHNGRFASKNWQDLAYVVDVEVSYIQGTPSIYKITKLYENEIFDPQD